MKTPYPTGADYNLFIKDPKRFIFDPVLSAGVPRSKSKVPVASNGEPLFFRGGWAKIYIFDSAGKVYGLRVWLIEVEEAASRYQVITDFIRKQSLPFFVEHEFIPNGILVNGRRYPILRMEWAEGYSLQNFIGINLNQPTLIESAAEAFCEMVTELHVAQITHCDLQSENIIVRVNNGAVHYKLVDYDTLIVPALVGKPVSNAGLPAYQHPARKISRTATEKDDFFSELVIYLSLRAIAEDSSLWAKFPAPDGLRDKELLFKESDYASSVPTQLFRQLYSMGGVVQKLTVILWNFSRCQSIAHLLPLERACELAMEVNAPNGAVTPSNDFEKRLKSKLDEAKSSPDSSRDWLDDRSFRSLATPPAAPSQARGTTFGPHPSFSTVLTGFKVGTQELPSRPSLIPTSPSSGSGGLMIAAVVIAAAAIVVGGVSLTTIMLSRSYQAANQPSVDSPLGATLFTSTPTVSNTPYAVSTPFVVEPYVPPQPPSANTPIAGSAPLVEQPYIPPQPPPPVTYRVVNVVPGDFLNVRAGPGSNYDIIVRLWPNTVGIQLGSARYHNGDTFWQEIFVENWHGFVSEAFLEQVNIFCAIAFSQQTGRFGEACGYATRAEAEKNALSSCGAGDARIVGWSQNSYLALAQGSTAWGVARASTNEGAAQQAVVTCGSGDCRLKWCGLDAAHHWSFGP